jgi:hypothetical protein
VKIMAIGVGPAFAIGCLIALIFLIFGQAGGSQADTGFGAGDDMGAGTMDGYGYQDGGQAGSQGETTWNTDPSIAGDPNY